jgi:hypothetical protein
MNKLELLDELKKIDETILLEILEITSTDLVDNFLDKITDNIDKLYRYLEQ